MTATPHECGAGPCVGCGRTWCRDEQTSPGEARGLCRDCWLIEGNDYLNTKDCA